MTNPSIIVDQCARAKVVYREQHVRPPSLIELGQEQLDALRAAAGAVAEHRPSDHPAAVLGLRVVEVPYRSWLMVW